METKQASKMFTFIYLFAALLWSGKHFKIKDKGDLRISGKHVDSLLWPLLFTCKVCESVIKIPCFCVNEFSFNFILKHWFFSLHYIFTLLLLFWNWFIVFIVGLLVSMLFKEEKVYT